MEFKKPKIKKKSLTRKKYKFPLKGKEEIIGLFNGDFITVRDSDSMIYLYEAGNFGKGNLSKGEPNYSFKRDDIPKVIFHHHFMNQKTWNTCKTYHQPRMLSSSSHLQKLSFESLNSLLQFCFNDFNQESWETWKGNHGKEHQNLIPKSHSHRTALPFLQFKLGETDYEDEHFKSLVNNILQLKQFKNSTNAYSKSEEVIILETTPNPHMHNFLSAVLNARLDKLACTPVENLYLNLEESLFLKIILKCLKIVDLNFSEINVSNMWEKFKAVRKNFIERYITYHYYRSKGWIVRTGLKFGGDFLLYKCGPAYYHSSFLVKVMDRKQKLTWREFLATNRLVETFNKDLVLTCVSRDSTLEKKSFPDVLSGYSIQEIVVKRWFPSKERLMKVNLC